MISLATPLFTHKMWFHRFVCSGEIVFYVSAGGPGSADGSGSWYEAGGVCAYRVGSHLLGGHNNNHMWTVTVAAIRGVPRWPACRLLVWHHDRRPPPNWMEQTAGSTNETSWGWAENANGNFTNVVLLMLCHTYVILQVLLLYKE